MMVKKSIYIMLCVFLGGVGVHKFYAGKWLQGLLYLAFCWTGVPVFLAVIDLLVGIFKKSDIYGQMII